jgi:Kef-type K+ transport system membrane component KefB
MMVGTGMLVTWIGVGWFLDVGVAAVLFGVGAIYLFGQLLRVTVKKRPVLWELVALGLACVLASFAPMVGLEIRLGAVILVGVGSLLMFWRNKA